MSSVTMYEMKQTEEQKKNATIWNRAYKQGQKDVLDQVLEIIYNVAHTAFAAEDYHHNEGGKCVIQLIREAVEGLKGGDQE